MENGFEYFVNYNNNSLSIEAVSIENPKDKYTFSNYDNKTYSDSDIYNIFKNYYNYNIIFPNEENNNLLIIHINNIAQNCCVVLKKLKALKHC